MIAGVHPRTFLVLPRRVWRVLKAKAPKPTPRENRGDRVGFLQAFEQMLNHQVNLAFREIND